MSDSVVYAVFLLVLVGLTTAWVVTELAAVGIAALLVLTLIAMWGHQ